MSRSVWIVLALVIGLGCSSPPPADPVEPDANAGARDDDPGETQPEPDPKPDPEPVTPVEPEPEPEPEVPNRSPQAKVDPSSVQATVGKAISLDASASSDPDGSIVSYTWRVGNGTPTTSESPTFTHTFHEAGLQTILLTVTDDRGGTAVFVVQAVIKD